MNRLSALALAAALAGCATGGKPTAVQPTPSPSPAVVGGSPNAAGAAGAAGAAMAGGPVPSTAPRGVRPLAELLRGAKHQRGFFDTYETGDALFLVIPNERLGQDFLLNFQIAQGIGAGGVFGGTMLNIFEAAIVALERHGERVFLVQRPARFTAPEGSAIARAVDLSFGSSVLESARVEWVRGDSAVLINIQDWVLSDLSNVGQRVRFATAAAPTPNPPPASFDRSRSYLESVKSFPDNLNIRAKLTFRPAQPRTIASVPDDRFVPVSIFYSFARLPEQPMRPRPADDRVGYFVTARKDFSLDEKSFFVRYVNRWRLEPSGETVDGLMVPVRPIVYYLDPNIPEEYRPFMAAGVEAWNTAFEAAGWKHAIRAEPLPDSADAEDLRYATLRWNTSDQPGYNAIGPSIVDPRTGEILDADILFEASMVLGWKSFWRSNISPVMAVEEAFAVSDAELEALGRGAELASVAAELSAQGTLLRAMLAARGDIGPRDAVPLAYVGEALKRVTMHEVGHSLGLRHNFRSSTDTPMERLHDREWAREHGLASSVMEYPAINVAPHGVENGYYYTPSIGSYDRWAITYGYTHDDARAMEVARLASQPGHAYGTDEDAVGAAALDPSVNTFDLGSDPLAWARERAELIRSVWHDLPRHVLDDNSRYADLTDAFHTLLVQYARALVVAPKYIGGQYHHRDRVGDPGGRPPFVAVPRREQRQALEFLGEYAFGERAFQVPQSTLAQLGANRWTHWGETNTYNGRIDYPLHEQVLGVQTALLNQLTSPFLFARIRDGELKFGAHAVLPIPEVMEELTRSIWTEVWGGAAAEPKARNISAMRRDLQRAHLDRMGEIVATPPARMPADARALARYRLDDLDGRIGRVLAAGGLDAYTRAHLAESRQRIARVLEAGLEVERNGR